MLAPGESRPQPVPQGYGDNGQVGRALKGGAGPRHRKPGQPHGGAWEALRARLWARWRGQGRPCFHCGCPDTDQIEHLISTQRAPWLAMAEENLVPTHGRCPHCGLSCNTLAASNSAERDAQGRSVPFSTEYKRRKIAELAARNLAEPAPSARPRGNPGKTPAQRSASVGREW